MGLRLGKGCRLHVIHTHPVNYHSNGKFFLFSNRKWYFFLKRFSIAIYISLDIQNAATKTVFFRHARGTGILRLRHLLSASPWAFWKKICKIGGILDSQKVLFSFSFVLPSFVFCLTTNHSNVTQLLFAAFLRKSFWYIRYASNCTPENWHRT